MSFDTDPGEQPERILCYHPESDCLFVANSRNEFASICEGELVDDVTGVQWAEDRFKARGE